MTKKVQCSADNLITNFLKEFIFLLLTFLKEHVFAKKKIDLLIFIFIHSLVKDYICTRGSDKYYSR